MDLGGQRRPGAEPATRAAMSRPGAGRATGRESVGGRPPAAFAPAVAEALTLVQQGAFAQGRARAEAYLAEHPDDSGAVLAIGLSHHRARDYVTAAPWLERARALAPTDPRVLHFLGYCRFYLGELDLAKEAFTAHLAADPGESDSHFGLGLVALEEGDFNEASGRFEHAIALIQALEETDPEHYESRKSDLAKCFGRLGDVAFGRGEYEAARDWLEDSIAAEPNQYTIYYTLSQVERRLGNDERADQLQQIFDAMAARRQGQESGE